MARRALLLRRRAVRPKIDSRPPGTVISAARSRPRGANDRSSKGVRFQRNSSFPAEPLLSLLPLHCTRAFDTRKQLDRDFSCTNDSAAPVSSDDPRKTAISSEILSVPT